MISAAEKFPSFADADVVEVLPRYYKYRFRNKTDIVIGAIDETQLLTPAYKVCLAMKENVERIFNANVIFDWIPFENAVNFSCSTNISEADLQIDFLFIPMDGSTLYGCQEAFPTSIFSFGETMIVTAEPNTNVVPTLNLLKMETMVSLLFAVSCCVITLLLTVSIRASVSRPSRSFLADTLRNFWDTLCIFFFEPYPKLSSVLSARVACISWLIGVLVIYIELSSSLQSEFSIKTYDTVSSLKDLADHRDVKPFVMRNALVFRYIDFMKDQNRHMQTLYDEISNNERFFDLFEDMIQEDFYFKLADTLDKKALVIRRFYLKLILGFDLQNIKEKECPGIDDEPCSLGDLPLVQIGVDEEKRDILTLVMSKQLYQCTIFREQVNLAVLVLFETKCVDSYFFENAYNLEFVTWKAPVESFEAQTLTDMSGLISMFFYMSLISISVFLLEVVFGNLQLRFRSHRWMRRQNSKNSLCFGHRRPNLRRKFLPNSSQFSRKNSV